MKRTLIIAVLLLASSSVAMAQATDKKTEQAGSTEQIVLKMTNDWIDAERRRDGAALDRILDTDFVGTAPSGDILTKKMIVPDPKGPGGGLSFTGGDLAARVYDDVAVVTGNGTWIPKEEGTLTFTTVFVKREGRWQMVCAHISKVEKQ
jgi:hypothetical protein